MKLLGRETSLTISSAVWIQYSNVSDRRTDGGTDGQTPCDIVQPPEGGTVQLRLHNIFLLFFDIWTLLIKISKGVALTCLGNFHKINFYVN